MKKYNTEPKVITVNISITLGIYNLGVFKFHTYYLKSVIIFISLISSS